MLLFALLLTVPALAETPSSARLEAGWAAANYGTAPEAARLAQIDTLLAAIAPAGSPRQRAETLAWRGMLLTTKAGIVRGLTGLRLVTEARDAFEASMALDPAAADAMAARQLGVLYFQVPGAPIAFGSRRKAQALISQALAVDPRGIANNLAMADFLIDTKRFAEAERFLQVALQAPVRPGMAADAGLRSEAQAQMRFVATKLGRAQLGRAQPGRAQLGRAQLGRAQPGRAAASSDLAASR